MTIKKEIQLMEMARQVSEDLFIRNFKVMARCSSDRKIKAIAKHFNIEVA